MSTARYVHWQDGEMWLGYFEEFPDYLTQGATLEDLQESLRDLYRDLTSGEIPGIRKVAEDGRFPTHAPPYKIDSDQFSSTDCSLLRNLSPVAPSIRR
jgi:hypothetical protein